METQELQQFEQIGEGRFKKVYAGYHADHGPVALLRIPGDTESNELRMLGELSRIEESFMYFPEIFAAKEDPSGDVLLAQEISTLGSVRSMLMEPDSSPLLTPIHRLNIAAQLAAAVDFLERACVIHTDIACRNVLLFQLDEEPEFTTAKLTDFGFAKQLPSGVDQITCKQPQATRWCAPETVASNTWSYMTDVWSLGASLWELFAGGAAPWKRFSKRADVAKRLRALASCEVGDVVDLSEEFPLNFSDSYPLAAHKALFSCLRVDPVARAPACCVAHVLEELVDLSDMFDGQFDKIDEGLDMVKGAMSASSVPLDTSNSSEQAPRIQERSRVRRGSPDPVCEAPRNASTTSPASSSHTYNPESPAAVETRSSNQKVVSPPRTSSLSQATLEARRQHKSCFEPSRQDDTATAGWRQQSARSSQGHGLMDESASARGGSVTIWTPGQSGVASTPLASTPLLASTPVASTPLLSTPSTADTPTKTSKTRPHERVMPLKPPVKAEGHFDALKAFLSSPEAARSLSRDDLAAMRQEVAAAQVREAYWSGVSSQREGVEDDGCKIVPLEQLGTVAWKAQEAPVGTGKWTLWSFLNPALRREDFSSELEARAALNARERTPGVPPCVLKGPSGMVLASSSWHAV